MPRDGPPPGAVACAAHGRFWVDATSDAADAKAKCQADPEPEFLSNLLADQDSYDVTFNVANYESKHSPQTGYMLNGCADIAPFARSDV